MRNDLFVLITGLLIGTQQQARAQVVVPNASKDVIITGRVLALPDSSAVPGAELIFNGKSVNEQAFSVCGVTQPDSGTYFVAVPSGRSYFITVMKDGMMLAAESLEVPLAAQDSTAVIVKDFFSVVDRDYIRIRK